MRRRRALASALMLLAGAGPLAGCGGRNAAAAQAPAPNGTFVADTVRGLVTIVGNEPLTSVLLTTADGRRWQLAGDSLLVLRAAAGLEVMVRGTVLAPDRDVHPRDRLQVTRFLVRGADGVAAVDGMLERDNTGFALRLADGRRAALAAVPTTLRERIGARIWWAGPLDRAPIAYGVLAARR